MYFGERKMGDDLELYSFWMSDSLSPHESYYTSLAVIGTHLSMV